MNIRLLLMFLPLLSLLAGCGQEASRDARSEEHPLPEDAIYTEVSGVPGGTLHYPMAGEPDTFNYLAAANARSRLVAYLTTATVLEFDAVEQEVVDGVTLSHEVSSDGRTVSLRFRKDLYFSDGSPFSADDVVYTLQRIYSPDSSNVVKDTLLFDGQPMTIRQPGRYEVELVLPRPVGAIEYLLTNVPIFPGHLLEGRGDRIEDLWTVDTPVTEMAGLGPFSMERHEPGLRTVFVRNPHYWKVDQEDNRLPYLDQVVFEYIEDPNNQLLRLQAGQLDLVDQLLRPEDMEILRGQQEIEVLNAGASSNLTFLWFNLNPGISSPKGEWFKDRRFREAVSRMIDRDAIVGNVFQGQATPAFTLLPPSLKRWYASGLPEASYSIEQAERLLREAGFRFDSSPDGRRLLGPTGQPVEFTLLIPSNEVVSRTAAIVQEDLGRVGINASIQREEMRSVISRVTGTFDYDASIMNIEFPVDPADYLNLLLSSGPMHMWAPRQEQPATEWEAEIDRLMTEQQIVFDHKERYAIFKEVQMILAEQLPVIPLVNRDVLVAHRSDLGNLRPANIFPYALWNVWEIYRSPEN